MKQKALVLETPNCHLEPVIQDQLKDGYSLVSIEVTSRATSKNTSSDTYSETVWEHLYLDYQLVFTKEVNEDE